MIPFIVAYLKHNQIYICIRRQLWSSLNKNIQTKKQKIAEIIQQLRPGHRPNVLMQIWVQSSKGGMETLGVCSGEQSVGGWVVGDCQ